MNYGMEGIMIKDIRHGMKNLNLTFIILDVGNAVIVKENREVRTVKVADASACINLSLWGESGQLLFPGDIVRLTKGYANIWRDCLTLYMGKAGDLDKIGEFSMVFNEQLNMSEPNLKLEGGPPIPVNNGNLANNGNRPIGGGAPRAPANMISGPPNLGKNIPRFPPSDPPPNNPNKHNKLNNNGKPTRGGMKGNMVRSERR